MTNFPVGLDLQAELEAGNIFVTRTRPVNNESTARIWGIEASAEQQFTGLPGIWSGLGVFANYVYTDSSKDQPEDFRDPITFENEVIIIPDVRFERQPAHSGTVALTYNKYGIDSTLSYTYQDRSPRNFEPNGLSTFNDEVDSLDFRLGYALERFGGRYQFVLEATDLLNDPFDPVLTQSVGGEDGVPQYITNRSYTGGRELRLGVIATF